MKSFQLKFFLLPVILIGCYQKDIKNAPNLTDISVETCHPKSLTDSLFLEFRCGMTKNQCDSLIELYKKHESGELIKNNDSIYTKIRDIKFKVSFFFHDCYLHKIELVHKDHHVNYESFNDITKLYSKKYYKVNHTKYVNTRIYKSKPKDIPLHNESSRAIWDFGNKKIQITYWKLDWISPENESDGQYKFDFIDAVNTGAIRPDRQLEIVYIDKEFERIIQEDEKRRLKRKDSLKRVEENNDLKKI